MSSVFADIKVIGECEEPEWIAAKLQQMQDPEFQVSVLEDTSPTRSGGKGILEFLNLVQDQPWMYATHKFGYIPPRKPGSMEPQIIQHPSAIAVVKMLAQRNENVAVQKFYLGLDFENMAMGCRLAEGNYIAIQVPDEIAIDWKQWIYKPDIGAIVNRTDNYETLPYNYVIFRVSRYEN
ncbi:MULTISPECIES: hypothetical protein [unclassified Tolypothrix]|uniref:hypothetical protein n=1 Tax=unclassified Tolypothrix TaxID=2649714 RepID=UPI0005EAA382|nr:MULTISPECIES: hypothetical protein [unclassified Tolypothrix]BAY95316.1 hypothetical protein NIES3275_73730 [Microchaete diplosiphon NIES-3275]EKE96728.1 hypothetical protein FDUTEX481_06393 [Tolypothrix sp. PCC 7601]MBE9086503.1 hypothetical protein [Tolypothrix sp. LEGE 11397]UYD30536.1 hypothetical protein HGR01_36745 [Tolypothrix sp. PCC 7712]UYD38333.1 hypothetical protein HG267_38180 [Tolypothrix sp. PCC 7601]